MKTSNDALSEAASQGDVKSIRTLLSESCTPKNKKRLDVALGCAVQGGYVKAAELLLKAGASPDSKTVSSSLLIEAAEGGDLAMVKLLVEGGADMHRKIAGSDAFEAALEMDEVKVAEYLKSRGADWATPTLRHACEHGDLRRARQALEAGANLESRSPMACDTPLMIAAGNGHARLVQVLLQRGAKPNARVEGTTALFEAVSHGQSLEVFDALVKAGANIHADWDGETVLMAAARCGCLAIVKRLVELGADVQARDKDRGNSVMDHARSSKNKELIAYLNSLSVAADRDAPRTLARALAREYGGKPVEHVAGFAVNAKFAGTKCQLSIGTEGFHLFVHGLDFGESEFKRGKEAQLVFSTTKPHFERLKIQRVEGACPNLRFLVFRALGTNALPAPFVISFCKKHKTRFEQMKLSGPEKIRLGTNFASFSCPHLDVNLARPRLKAFARLVQGISRPPKPERQLFAGEWLLKPALKSSAKAASAHLLGGKLEQQVACPHCGCVTNLIAQVDLSDPALPKTALGCGKLSVFWCLACLEWDAAFFDVSGSVPKPLNKEGKKAKRGKVDDGEKDLPERRMTLVPVAVGNKAGRKSKVGGTPAWIQLEQTPDCPKCQKSMAFVLQLVSDSHISYCDMGMLYAFACTDCHVAASLIQSH